MRALGAQRSADRTALLASIGAVVLAARAFGLICLDGVYNAFRDEAGFLAECEQGRTFGFDGKTLIHPSQIAGANDAFAPSAADLKRAQEQIDAFAQARAQGKALAVVAGEMIEDLHVQSAQALLEKHRKIKELNLAGANK